MKTNQKPVTSERYGFYSSCHSMASKKRERKTYHVSYYHFFSLQWKSVSSQVCWIHAWFSEQSHSSSPCHLKQGGYGSKTIPFSHKFTKNVIQEKQVEGEWGEGDEQTSQIPKGSNSFCNASILLKSPVNWNNSTETNYGIRMFILKGVD